MSDQKETVVFTNGCFDVLHRGHIELLRFCRTLGDRVIVGLNSDSSTRAIKGPSRPYNTQEDRKTMLEELRSVDEVIVFHEDTPYRLIQNLSPDIIVKGSDYAEDQVVGRHLSEVVIFDIINGYSTTKAIQDSGHR